MKIGESIKSNVGYVKDLVGSGLEGAGTFRKAALEDSDVASEWSDTAHESWIPALIGVALGALGGYFIDDRRSARNAVVGGLVGGAVAIGGHLAWGSRHVTGAMARGAARNINSVRDQHWLSKNPVTYA